MDNPERATARRDALRAALAEIVADLDRNAAALADVARKLSALFSALDNDDQDAARNLWRVLDALREKPTGLRALASILDGIKL